MGNNIYIYPDCISIVGHCSQPEKIRSWLNNKLTILEPTFLISSIPSSHGSHIFQVFSSASFSITCSTCFFIFVCSWMITSVGYQLFIATPCLDMISLVNLPKQCFHFSYVNFYKKKNYNWRLFLWRLSLLKFWYVKFLLKKYNWRLFFFGGSVQ